MLPAGKALIMGLNAGYTHTREFVFCVNNKPLLLFGPYPDHCAALITSERILTHQAMSRLG